MTVFRRRVRMTLAQAHLEREGRCLAKDRGNGPLYYWNVTVMTAPGTGPHQQRHYRLIAEEDYTAAQEALRLFGEELDFVTIEV